VEEVKIEKGIPIPSISRRHNTYPFREMEIGDSFAISEEKEMRLRSIASKFARDNGVKFTVQVDHDTHLVRCWRIE